MREDLTRGQRFVNWLEKLKGSPSWRAARAALRRSLAFDPGTYPAVMPYVEPFLQNQEEEGWRREAYYLVAGLYALKDGQHTEGRSLAQALWEVRAQRDSASIERRFMALLDADRDQIGYRLRQVMLLAEGKLDFAQLLDHLLLWFHPDRKIQAQWAREFYKAARGKENDSPEGEVPLIGGKEVSE